MSQKELCRFYPMEPGLDMLPIKKLAVLSIGAIFQNVHEMDYNRYATVNVLSFNLSEIKLFSLYFLWFAWIRFTFSVSLLFCSFLSGSKSHKLGWHFVWDFCEPEH